MIAVLLAWYPGAAIDDMTMAVFYGLYERVFTLPPVIVAKGDGGQWMQRSTERIDTEMLIRAQAPAGSIEARGLDF